MFHQSLENLSKKNLDEDHRYRERNKPKYLNEFNIDPQKYLLKG
jgi:hypothetical protein